MRGKPRIAEVKKKVREMAIPLADLSKRVRLLERRVKQITTQLSQAASITIPIATLAPEPYDLIRTIPVVVQLVEDEYLASFVDANVNAAGCNETDAVADLKEVILSVFEYLSAQPKSKLGLGPSRQLAVLSEFIQKRPRNGKDHNKGIGSKDRKEAKSGDRQIQRAAP